MSDQNDNPVKIHESVTSTIQSELSMQSSKMPSVAERDVGSLGSVDMESRIPGSSRARAYALT
jgi:hypothetical protein